MLEDEYCVAEYVIIGSSRFGVHGYFKGQLGLSANPAGFTDTTLWRQVPWFSLEYNDVIKPDCTNFFGNNFTDPVFANHITGQKQY